MASTNHASLTVSESLENRVSVEVTETSIGFDQSKRTQWGSSLEFLMSCIAMSVGLGNIWRFPFAAYENGGGAFLVPYIIVLVLIGRPMYYMDMCLGQFSSKSSVKVFEHLKPAIKGIGFVQVYAAACIATYYCSLVAIILFYLISSFTSDLPWIKCTSKWDSLVNATCLRSSEKLSNNTASSISSSELWFTREVLNEKTSIDDGIGLPEWKLAICLFVAWLCSFLVSVKGIRSSGRASYFLALFPYVIMVILLIRAVTLQGSANGILYLVSPDWRKIFSANVWYHAVTQCFFSLNVGGGAIIMYASFNDFRHNINRDAMVVTTLDTFTSLLAGVTTFGILGNLAHELGVDVKNVITSGGAGLVFISYPEAIAKFDRIPWFFAILFFLMLFVLGVGSLVALHNCVNTAISDSFPSLRSWTISAGTAAAGFVIGLVYVTPGGQIILTVVDFSTGTFVIFTVGVLETVAVMWFYGVEHFCDDVEFMLQHKVAIFWRITWGIITPGLLLIIFVYFLATIPRLTYGHHRIPDIALACGWALVAIAIMIMIHYMLQNIYKSKTYGFPQMAFKAFSSESWGPQNTETRQQWRAFKQKKIDETIKSSETWLQRKAHFFIGR